MNTNKIIHQLKKGKDLFKGAAVEFESYDEDAGKLTLNVSKINNIPASLNIFFSSYQQALFIDYKPIGLSLPEDKFSSFNSVCNFFAVKKKENEFVFFHANYITDEKYIDILLKQTLDYLTSEVFVELLEDHCTSGLSL
ncbi:MAG: hypothetical protein E7680_05465 [Ruminococcaceae bacterium]|nr:hypothetical protein [Oscillospiraceae bacterium]